MRLESIETNIPSIYLKLCNRYERAQPLVNPKMDEMHTLYRMFQHCLVEYGRPIDGYGEIVNLLDPVESMYNLECPVLTGPVNGHDIHMTVQLLGGDRIPPLGTNLRTMVLEDKERVTLKLRRGQVEEGKYFESGSTVFDLYPQCTYRFDYEGGEESVNNQDLLVGDPRILRKVHSMLIRTWRNHYPLPYDQIKEEFRKRLMNG